CLATVQFVDELGGITTEKINNRLNLVGIASDSRHIAMSLTAKVKRQEHHEDSNAPGRSSDR
uniref:hypothetical protein n=1 Tax=Roseinatronobacter sp. TaxID=1945755 RepID=UPI0025F1DD7D